MKTLMCTSTSIYIHLIIVWCSHLQDEHDILPGWEGSGRQAKPLIFPISQARTQLQPVTVQWGTGVPLFSHKLFPLGLGSCLPSPSNTISLIFWKVHKHMHVHTHRHTLTHAHSYTYTCAPYTQPNLPHSHSQVTLTCTHSPRTHTLTLSLSHTHTNTHTLLLVTIQQRLSEELILLIKQNYFAKMREDHFYPQFILKTP
jgi:hypothetical protein